MILSEIQEKMHKQLVLWEEKPTSPLKVNTEKSL